MNGDPTGTTPGPSRATLSGIFGPISIRRPPAPAVPPPNWRLPLFLFLITCASTWATAGANYALGIMGILTCHEMGHYLQARRYRVPASLPYFIPLPLISLTGTLGAVIGMRPRSAGPRALYDIAITGPLVGLVPSLVLSYYGLQLSELTSSSGTEATVSLGEPLVFQWLMHWVHGPLPEGQDVLLHPLAFAGWVGIFITALNLAPIGQLDGGHILYTLMRRRANWVSRGLLVVAGGLVTADAIQALRGAESQGYWAWWLMLILLAVMGVDHPPTADDSAPLDGRRQVLGWLTLLFFPLGFTPVPFVFPTP